MRRRVSLLLAAALACRPTAQSVPETATPAAAVDPSPLRFAWPLDAHATVTERVFKKGRHATMRYGIVTRREGSTILVYYRDFAFVEFEGVDLGDPAVREQLAALERQVAGAIPPYRIAADGTWLGCGELETLLDGLAGVLPAADIATFRALLSNPKIRAVVDAKLRDVWQAWVEGWLGLALRPGDRREGSSRIEIAGTSVVLPYTVERLAGDPATLHLRSTSELTGDAAKAMLGAALDEFTAAMRDRLGNTGLDTAAATRELAVRRLHVREATLDPATLRPTRALSRVTITVGDDKATTESIESHEWTFVWD
jgi:hypothetical protein